MHNIDAITSQNANRQRDHCHNTGPKGNVEDFQKLVKEIPHVLHDVALHPVNTPLYIACAARHLDLVNEILRMKPEFAGELNPDGYSPQHVVSANGYAEIVKALVTVDVGLCHLKGREGRTLFHFAAMKGKTDVVSLMLLRREECIADITIQMATALHLAVKNAQFESFEILGDEKERCLNVKDELGNTILHLAIWKNQRLAIELFLGKSNGTPHLLEVTAANHSGLTSLDLLLLFPSEAVIGRFSRYFSPVEV
ncbi:Ankyrin repeat-containing protein [Drosera capensis]